MRISGLKIDEVRKLHNEELHIDEIGSVCSTSGEKRKANWDF
jgi:hypothetical protein